MLFFPFHFGGMFFMAQFHQGSRLRACLFGTAALVSVAQVFSAPVHAQDAAAGVTEGEEDEVITVTARKRGAESLQAIPGSIQAITGDDLSGRASTGFDDYSRFVPGLSANNSGTGQTQLTIRGVTSTRLNHANPNIPSTAGIYFDETAVTTSGFNPDAGLVDIARIEVLRGPQGTLFGASSMSGVIRVIPNDPQLGEFTADAGFTTFLTDNGDPSYNGDLTVNVPIHDTLALRVSGYGIERGGYIDNVYEGPANVGQENFNSESILGGRAALLWTPTDTLRIKLSGLYQEARLDGRADEYRPNDPLEGIGLNSRSSNEGNILFPGESVAVTDELQIAKFLDETFDDEFAVIALQGDKTFGAFQFTSITSYVKRDFENLIDDTIRTRDWINLANFAWWDIDRDGSPTFTPGTGVEGVIAVGSDPLDPQQSVPVLRAPFENNTQLDRFSQELRVVSDLDGPINFLAGFYYEDESRDFQQDLVVPGLDAWLDEFSGFITTPAFGAERADNFFEGRYSFDTSQIALFGEVSLTWGDFELIGGGRYFDYKQEADVFFGGFIEFSEDRLADTIEEDGFNPKAELVYRPTDNLTLFAGYSEGFRLGSVQQFISAACTGELQSIGVLNEGQGPEAIPTTVSSDSLSNYEAGVKATLFGGSTTFNATGYFIDWTDVRSQVFLGCGWILEGSFVDIESKGVEVNMESQLTRDLFFYTNFGWNNAEIVEVAPLAETLASVGDRAPMTPEWTVSAGFVYVRQDLVADEYDLVLRGDISYVSDMVSSLGNVAEQTNQGFIQNLEIPSNTVLNSYLGLENDRWSATFFVRNLTDERIITGVDIDRRGPAAFTRARPRNYGIQVRVKM